MSFSSFPVIVLLLLRRGALVHIGCLFKACNRGTIDNCNVCKTTTVVRIRVRERIVRIRIGETAIRIRIVARTTHGTVVYVSFCLFTLLLMYVIVMFRYLYFYVTILPVC